MRWKYRAAAIMVIVMVTVSGCNSPSERLSKNLDVQPSTDVESVSDFNINQCSNKFGMDIFKQEIKNQKNKNVVISPVSLFTSLCYLVNGANGNTRNEMKKAMNITKFSDEELNKGISSIFNLLNNSTRYENTGYIKLYNSLWIDKKYNVKDNFINVSKQYYDSEVFKQVFSDKSTVDNMNNWISDKSGGLIKNPISNMDERTCMAILNILHFKGKWVNQFNKSKTTTEKFNLKSGGKKDVKMMNDERLMFYYEDGDVKAGIFNYLNGNMVILLPNGDIDKFASGLNSQKIMDYVKKSANYRVKVKIPAFNTEYKEDLTKTLNSLGMSLPFDQNKADFSNINEDSSPLWVSKVFHNCVVKTDEEGTEAAALTTEYLAGSSKPPEEIKEFYADKPFIFAIMDIECNLMLFVGKVENPS